MTAKVLRRMLCVVALAGCVAPNTQVSPPDTGAGTTAITDLSVVDLPQATRIAITGSGPLNYTAFKLESPLQLIVDLSETTLGAFESRRDVGLDPVIEIVPEQTGDGGRIARVNLMLSRSAEYQIARDDSGTLLTIDFAKTKAVEAPIEQAVAQDVTPAPPPQVKPAAATRVTKVRIDPRRTFVDVRIDANGPIAKPKVFAVGTNRLVIDLPGVRNAIKPAVVKAEANTLVRQARIGQHREPQKVRIVLDLKKGVSHTMEARARGLTVRLVRAEAAVPPGSPLPESRPDSPVPPVAVPDGAAPPPPPPDPLAPVAVESTGGRTLGAGGYTGRKISLDFQDAEVSNVLRLIADVSDLNMVVGEEVKGKVTLKLFNVPWDHALDIILKSKGLGQVREGNIIRIDSNGNIAKQQDETAKAKEAQVKAEDLKTLIIPINYAKAGDLATTLRKNLSSRGELTVNEPTNSLIAKDVPQNIADIQQLIKLLDLPTPQVLIETRIVQANTNFARDLGVQWGASAKETFGANQIGLNAGAAGEIGSQTPAFAVNLPAAGGAGAIGNVGFSFGRLTGVNPFNLDLRLSAGEAMGETKIISSPRIVTLDNKQAVIQQGDSVPYAQTTEKGTTTEFVDATLSLTVTPHITPNGSVIMKIKATKNAIGATVSAGPTVSKREASTEVMVQDGETTVIGGIFENTKTESVVGVPWLRNIPVLGWLFKKKSVSDANQELLIFITPTIVKKI